MKQIHFDTIDSTNQYLIKNSANVEDFTFVDAFFQTHGKGRENRIWSAESGENLLFSYILKEEKLVNDFGSISMCSAVAIAKALESEFHLNNVTVKWPNDVYVNGKKICGILLQGKVPSYLIVGIGVNVNQTCFEGEYRITPTSVALETENKVNLETFKELVYKSIINEVELVKQGNTSYIAYLKEHDYLKNKECNVSSYNPNKLVNVIGIQDDNSLLIDDAGEIIKITSGEVMLKNN